MESSSHNLAELARALGPLRLNYLPPYVYPHPKQEIFLRAPQRDVFFGGSAGPGKSTALLMGALQYVDVPRYAAILFRRSFADLEMPGALLDKSREWLGDTDARYNGETYTWTFPSKAKLVFGFLRTDDDLLKYKSAEFQFIGFDELTQFTERQFTYMFHRCRRPQWVEGMPELPAAPDGTTLADVPLRVRGASNPGGPGHEWAKARYVNPKTRRPGSRYVKALLSDNPSLDAASYVEMLAELEPVERERMLNGNWEVVESGGVFDTSAFKPIYKPPFAYLSSVRGWDIGKANGRGDYIVGVKTARLASGDVAIIDVVRTREHNSGRIEQLLVDTAIADGRHCTIAFEQEPGAMAALYTDALKRLLSPFAKVRSRTAPRTPEADGGGLTKSGRQSKLTKAQLYAASVNKGIVQILQRGWTAEFVAEHNVFPFGSHDDQVDAACLAHDMLPARTRFDLLAGHVKRGAGDGGLLRREL